MWPGCPPVAGLWAILPALALYALFGSSRLLSVGPESTTAVMTATVVGPLADGDAGRYASLAAALAVTVGLLCLVARAVRLGCLADLLSRPVLVGYLTGVGLIMMVDQLPRLTGVRTTESQFFPHLWSFVRHLPDVDAATVVLSAVALVFLFTVKRYVPALPGPLLTVILGTAAVTVFDLDHRHRITVIGEVPSGRPSLALPDLGELPHPVLPRAGGPDRRLHRLQPHRARLHRPHGRRARTGRQPGVPGAGCGQHRRGRPARHGFPVSGSASRTALAASTGAHSQGYSLVAATVVLAVLLFLNPLLSRTPSAVLGALVVYAAIRMIDLSGFRRLASFRRRELLAHAWLPGRRTHS